MKERPSRKGVNSEGHLPCPLQPVGGCPLHLEGQGTGKKCRGVTVLCGEVTICPTADPAHVAETTLFLDAWADFHPFKVSLGNYVVTLTPSFLSGVSADAKWGCEERETGGSCRMVHASLGEDRAGREVWPHFFGLALCPRPTRRAPFGTLDVLSEHKYPEHVKKQERRSSFCVSTRSLSAPFPQHPAARHTHLSVRSRTAPPTMMCSRRGEAGTTASLRIRLWSQRGQCSSASLPFPFQAVGEPCSVNFLKPGPPGLEASYVPPRS